MSFRQILACDGSAYFDDGSRDYAAFRCASTFPGKAREGYDDRVDLVKAAREKGWKIGPGGDAMCPVCGAPDARTMRLVEALGATLRSGQ